MRTVLLTTTALFLAAGTAFAQQQDQLPQPGQPEAVQGQQATTGGQAQQQGGQILQQVADQIEQADQALQNQDMQTASQALGDARQQLQQVTEGGQADPQLSQVATDVDQQLQTAEDALRNEDMQQASEALQQADESIQQAMQQMPGGQQQAGSGEPSVQEPDQQSVQAGQDQQGDAQMQAQTGQDQQGANVTVIPPEGQQGAESAQGQQDADVTVIVPEGEGEMAAEGDVEVIEQTAEVEVEPAPEGETVQIEEVPAGEETAAVVTETDPTVGVGAFADRPVAEVVGLDLVNATGEDLGEVGDVAIDASKKVFLIIDVGGFLGLGEKHIPIPLEEVQLQGEDQLVWNTQMTEDQLKEMEEFDASAYTIPEREQTFGTFD